MMAHKLRDRVGHTVSGLLRFCWLNIDEWLEFCFWAGFLWNGLNSDQEHSLSKVGYSLASPLCYQGTENCTSGMLKEPGEKTALRPMWTTVPPGFIWQFKIWQLKEKPLEDTRARNGFLHQQDKKHGPCFTSFSIFCLSWGTRTEVAATNRMNRNPLRKTAISWFLPQQPSLGKKSRFS